MASAQYVLPADTDPSKIPDDYLTRAVLLGCVPSVGDPTGLVTVFPSVVVTSPSLATVVFPDDTGQATTAEITTAISAAVAAEATNATLLATTMTNLTTALASFSEADAQAQTDLATLAASSDPLASIIARDIQGTLTLAVAMADLLAVLNIIAPNQVP